MLLVALIIQARHQRPRFGFGLSSQSVRTKSSHLSLILYALIALSCHHALVKWSVAKSGMVGTRAPRHSLGLALMCTKFAMAHTTSSEYTPMFSISVRCEDFCYYHQPRLKYNWDEHSHDIKVLDHLGKWSPINTIQE